MSEWISVKDDLPDDDCDISYLIYCPSLKQDLDFPGHAIMVSNPLYLKRQAKEGFVTHWMEIPEPPKELL